MIVVDTCTIIWQALDPSAISKKAKDTLTNADNGDGIYFCEISLWEIAMLMKKRRLVVNTPYQELVDLIFASKHYHLIGMNKSVAEFAVSLPKPLNADPADRIIAATSIVYDAPLVTADKNIRQSKFVKTIW